MTAARHTLHLSDEDVLTLLHAVQSHAVVLRQAAEILRDARDDTRAPSREADRLSHVNSLVQMHQKGCTCPSLVGGTES